MNLDAGQVIAEPGLCACGAVHVVHVRHRDFPELWVECSTAAEGAAHLANLLARSLDTLTSERRRAEMQRAMADVRTYIDAIDRPDARTQQDDHARPAEVPCFRSSAEPECAAARRASGHQIRPKTE